MPKLLFKDVEQDKIGKTILDNQRQLEDIRDKYEDRKQSCVDLSLPTRGDAADFMPGSVDRQGKGEKRGFDIYDDETVLAAETTVNGMQGQHVSPAFPWFKSEFYEQDVREEDDVKQWFRKIDTVIYEVLRRSETFYSSINSWFADAFCTGDGAMYIEPNLPAMSIEAIVPNLWQMYYFRDRFGKLSGCHRVYKMTGVELKEEFDKPIGGDVSKGSVVPDEVDKLLKEGKPFEEHEIINAVYPNSNFNPQRVGPEFMRYSSYTIYPKQRQGLLLRTKGYNTLNPIPLSIFRPSDEDYGLGITGKAIVAVARSNQLSKSLLNAADWATNPAWALNAALEPTAELWPGGRTLVDDINKESVRALDPKIQWVWGNEERERISEAIKEHFLVTLFKQFSNLEKDARVIELEEMMGEKATLISAFMGDINGALDKILDRVFDIAWRAGWLPRPPQILVDFLAISTSPQPERKVLIDYVGPLAQRQKRMFETQPVQMGLAAARPAMELYPEIADLINADRLGKKIFNSYHFPTDVMNNPDEIRAIRQQREQEKQLKMAAEMAETASKVVPALQGETAEGSPLAQLEGAA